MFVMTEEDESKGGEEKPEGLTIYKPEDQIYQKLYLCDYLRELYKSAEEENEPPAEKKKDWPAKQSLLQPSAYPLAPQYILFCSSYLYLSPALRKAGVK